MSRPQKLPDYDSQKVNQALLDSVSEAYCTLYKGAHPSLRSLAIQFDITVLKIRKMLITAGVYRTEVSDRVQALAAQGKSIADIQQELGLGRASVHSYLPYTKTIYNAPEASGEALRVRRFRQRQQCVMELRQSLAGAGYGQSSCGAIPLPKTQFWNAIRAFEGFPLQTGDGQKYSYVMISTESAVGIRIHPTALFLSDSAVEYAAAAFRSGTDIDKISGAGFLYPLFCHIGLLDAETSIDNASDFQEGNS